MPTSPGYQVDKSVSRSLAIFRNEYFHLLPNRNAVSRRSISGLLLAPTAAPIWPRLVVFSQCPVASAWTLEWSAKAISVTGASRCFAIFYKVNSRYLMPSYRSRMIRVKTYQLSNDGLISSSKLHALGDC